MLMLRSRRCPDVLPYGSSRTARSDAVRVGGSAGGSTLLGDSFSRSRTPSDNYVSRRRIYPVAVCGAKVIYGFFLDWMNIAIIRCMVSGVISSASFSNSFMLSVVSGVQQLAQNILPGGLRYPH